MNVINTYKISLYSALLLFLSLPFSCSRDIDDLEPAEFPTNGVIFIDGFSAGLNYAAFGGSKVTAFQVDNEVVFEGTSSMRFEVPDFEDPAGAYAGGTFFTAVGRDLRAYDVLTFWAKASKAANIDILGFGNDLGANRNQVTISNVAVNTNWEKYYIPIPDPAILTQERGMFFYSEGPEDERGYTFWIDEVQFEKLGTLSQPRPAILESQNQVITAETGDRLTIGGLSMTYNLPNGIDQRTDISPSYFSFISSDQSIATVGSDGIATVLDAGETTITAQVGGIEATGSLKIQSTGAPLLPLTPAPTPTENPDSVISMFSNVYDDVLVDTWNPFWEFSTALVDDVKIEDDDVKRYKQLNFVGILTEAEPIDATQMTHFHIDIWTPDPTDAPASFKVLLVDFGADGNFGGGDDSSHELSFTAPVLSTESWVSLDIPLSDFTGLTNRAQIAQLVLSGDLPNLFVDNVYYYNSGMTTGNGPTAAAPTPTNDPADVISLYSNAYTNVMIDTWSAEWDQAEVADVQIAGDDAKLYTGLVFAGVEFTSQTIDASAMERFHMDIWTPDAINPPAAFRIKIVDFGADGAFGGGDDVEHELTLDDTNTPGLTSGAWVEIDLPLSAFAGLTTTGSLAQLIISGDPNTIYIDNIYFYREDGGGNPTEPEIAAPEPMAPASDVISVFSDAYTNIANTNLNPDWGQATIVTEVSIDGNNTLLYTGLNYQGIELGSSQDVSGMSTLHIDFWTANSTSLNVFLISPGPMETPYALTVPTSGWSSVDIPLSEFSGVDLADVFQFKFEGDGNIYLDNIYFQE